MSKPKRWSTTIFSRALELYGQGVPVKRVIQMLEIEFGEPISYHTVHGWIYQSGRRDARRVQRSLPPPPPRTVWPDQVVQRARDLRERAGFGEVAIARVLAMEFDPAPKPAVIRDWVRNRTRLAA